MTMHLVGPWLTTTGKRKSKRKFRTAAGAAQARELLESWQGILSQHGIKAAANSRRKKTDFEPMKRAPLSYRGSDQPRIPSLPFTGEVCARSAEKVYTGDKCIGVTVMHKSCLQPVFNQQEAIDAAKMRR